MGMKSIKSVSAHVSANKNCSVRRMMILIASAHAYEPKQVSTNLFWHCHCTTKIFHHVEVLTIIHQNALFEANLKQKSQNMSKNWHEMHQTCVY